MHELSELSMAVVQVAQFHASVSVPVTCRPDRLQDSDFRCELGIFGYIRMQPSFEGQLYTKVSHAPAETIVRLRNNATRGSCPITRTRPPAQQSGPNCSVVDAYSGPDLSYRSGSISLGLDPSLEFLVHCSDLNRQ